MGFRDVRALLRESNFCTVPVYGTQKKLPWRESNHCQKYATLSVKAISLYHTGIWDSKKGCHGRDRTTDQKKVCTTNSHAYQLSQLVHYASADIFKYISTVPLTSSSYFVIFLYLFFSRSIVAIISIIKQLSRPFNQL